eukprot:GFKZ01009568.1.p1 GENE.GFKZ01009568.1~~GFKZ01009568.1.p1  ORF type:complete len:519 (+),score=69.48 GFKZ01009568.1:29-1558(+)
MTIPLLSTLFRHPPTSTALIDALGRRLTYSELLSRIDQLTHRLPPPTSSTPSAPPRIVLLQPPTPPFVLSLLATWAHSSIPVPLSPLYPPPALLPLVEDSTPTTIIAHQQCEPILSHLPLSHIHPLVIDDSLAFPQQPNHEPDIPHPAEFNSASLTENTSLDHPALIMFTSGTTGRAKGVVWTHDMVSYQTSMLSRAWRWSAEDRILNVLPLHHIHGLVNVVLTALSVGAQIEMQPVFDAKRVWEAFLRDEGSAPTVFMAVPAVYRRLIDMYEASAGGVQGRMREAAGRVRLFVCGSASLGRKEFDKWQRISGHRILERYGMTEAGMILGNDYDDRKQGMLGLPLPGVEVKVRSEGGEGGRLLVKGRGVFQEYWGRPDATRQCFDKDGWMDTGDVVVREGSGFRMLGRASTDIIKTGGYKVSAVEIEDVLKDCPAVKDCSVVGVGDEVLGESIVAAVVSESAEVGKEVVRFAEQRLPRYKVPRRVVVVDDFPRNVLGKVQKKLLKKSLQ